MMVFGIVAFIAIILLIAYMGTGKDDFAGVGGEVNKPCEAATYTCLGNVNNPGNLISVESVHWKGETTQSGQKFESFDTLSNGVRAWYINLFGKIKKGVITDTKSMIDVLTPAGNENPEPARDNYKAHVAKAQSWLELGRAVFDFEACPSWKNATPQEQTRSLNSGFMAAVDYSFKGVTPNYFTR